MRPSPSIRCPSCGEDPVLTNLQGRFWYHHCGHVATSADTRSKAARYWDEENGERCQRCGDIVEELWSEDLCATCYEDLTGRAPWGC